MRGHRLKAAGVGAALLIGVALAGCSSADLPSVPSAGELKQKVANTVEAVRQTADMAGSIELQFGGAVESGGCYATFLPQASPRQNVLQITSYNDPSGESFPSVFIRASTTSVDLRAFGGERLPAIIYLQEKQDGPVWSTADGEFGELHISSIKGDVIYAELTGELVDSQTGQRQRLSGKLHGSLKRAE